MMINIYRYQISILLNFRNGLNIHDIILHLSVLEGFFFNIHNELISLNIRFWS